MLQDSFKSKEIDLSLILLQVTELNGVYTTQTNVVNYTCMGPVGSIKGTTSATNTLPFKNISRSVISISLSQPHA